jgi:mycothiol system anti-sigma-R factor
MSEHLQHPEGMKHKCDETLAKVILALDGELSNAEEQQLLADINDCSYCLEKYNIEKVFKEFLANKMQKKPCAESVKTDIRNEIHRLAAGNNM